MNNYFVKVEVKLKPLVLDPQGKAVSSALNNLGYDKVKSTRIGKLIELNIEGESEDKVKEAVTEMCNKLLANTVIEDFSIHISEGINA